MSTQTLCLIDPNRAVVAVATVADTGEHFSGTIDLSATPPAVRAVFDEYEEIVLGQMFSFLDEVEAKVAALGLRAEREGATAVPIKDLQVYPTSGEVSFKLAVPAARTHVS
jgi:hypothetical protein